MRKSNSSIRTRLIRAGIAAGAVGAAVLIAPQAAWAVGVATPNVIMPNTATVLAEGTYTYNASNAAQVTNASTCATRYTAPNNTSLWDANKAAVVGNTHAVSVTVPASLPVGTNGVAKLYTLCVYDTNNTSSSVLGTSGPVYVSAAASLSTSSGPSAGGNQLTVQASADNALFTGLSTVGAIFTTANCPTTYGTPAAGMAATDVSRLSNTQATLTVPTGVTVANNSAAPAYYTVCFYNGNASTSAVIADAAYTVSKVVLSQNSGPTNGGNGLTITSVSNNLFAGITPGVLFLQAAGNVAPADCSGQATYTTTGSGTLKPVLAANLRKLGDNRAALTVPAVTIGGWLMCVYDQNVDGTGAVIASAPYSVSAAAAPNRVGPAAGPTTGNTRITVYGSGFPTEPGSISATLGGVPLINITPGTANSFTATTPPHSADNAATLVITTANGTVAQQNAFAYQNALRLGTNTAPNTTPTLDVEVNGGGFLGYTFGANGTYARAFLVNGVYDPSDADPTGGTQRANGPITECGNVLVVSDATLICTMTLNRRLTPTESLFNPATYTNASSPTATFVAGSKIVDLSTGSFTASDIGQVISDANTHLTAGTTIAAVLSPTRAVLSQIPATPGTSGVTTIGGVAVKSVAGNNTTTGVSVSNNGSTITVTSPLSQADVGRVIHGTATHAGGSGIDNGTTITSVAPNGLTATISAPAKGTLAFKTLDLFPAAPVPNGAYVMTVVNDGSVDANTTNPNYQQSAVTSGSTFTVAPA